MTAETTGPGRGTLFTDAEVREWADRHDLESCSLGDLRCAMDDAATLRAAPPAPAPEPTCDELRPGCIGFTNGCHCDACMAPPAPAPAPDDATPAPRICSRCEKPVERCVCAPAPDAWMAEQDARMAALDETIKDAAEKHLGQRPGYVSAPERRAYRYGLAARAAAPAPDADADALVRELRALTSMATRLPRPLCQMDVAIASDLHGDSERLVVAAVNALPSLLATIEQQARELADMKRQRDAWMGRERSQGNLRKQMIERAERAERDLAAARACIAAADAMWKYWTPGDLMPHEFARLLTAYDAAREAGK